MKHYFPAYKCHLRFSQIDWHTYNIYINIFWWWWWSRRKAWKPTLNIARVSATTTSLVIRMVVLVPSAIATTPVITTPSSMIITFLILSVISHFITFVDNRIIITFFQDIIMFQVVEVEPLGCQVDPILVEEVCSTYAS